MSAALRVGFIASDPALIEAFTDQKLATSLTTSEVNERLLHRILSEGNYRGHLASLRAHLERASDAVPARLERSGLASGTPAMYSPFVWLDTGVDTTSLAARLVERGVVVAPGQLFSASGSASTHMRLNVGACANSAVLALLRREIDRAA